MHRSKSFCEVILLFLLICFSCCSVLGAELPNRLRPEIIQADNPLTLSGVVHMAQRNFPRVLQEQAEVRATKRNITLQKVKEYNPDALMSYQVVAATHNRLTQTLFSSAVLPTTPGPGYDSLHEAPRAFSASGFIIDWAPIDFGLHKARIGLAKSEFQLRTSSYGLTLLDVSVEAASRFLDTLIMKEQVSVAQANVQRIDAQTAPSTQSAP